MWAVPRICFFTAPWDPQRGQQRSQEQLDLAQRPCPRALPLLMHVLQAESQAWAPASVAPAHVMHILTYYCDFCMRMLAADAQAKNAG